MVRNEYGVLTTELKFDIQLGTKHITMDKFFPVIIWLSTEETKARQQKQTTSEQNG